MICAACQQPMTGEPVAAFRDWTSNGKPTDRFDTELIIVHEGCVSEAWYVLRDGWFWPDEMEFWQYHLNEKEWFSWIHLDQLREAAYAYIERVLNSRHASTQPARNGARDITPKLRAQVMERDHFKCRRCGCGPERRELVVDHVAPVARGGWRLVENLQTLCVFCNMGKRDRAPTPHDYFNPDQPRVH
jgi:hypothetical protein